MTWRLHLVTILPISVAFFFGSRNAGAKVFYGACAAMMISAIMLSYSRGAFIGLLVVVAVFIATEDWRRQPVRKLLLAILGRRES